MLSLRSIIGVTIAVLVAGIALVRGGIVGWRAEEILRQQVGGTLTTIADSMAEKIDGDMRARANQALVLSALDALLDPRTAQRIVDEIHERDHSAAWIGVTDAKGTVRAGSDRVLVGRSIAERPVYKEALNGLFIGDVHEAVLLASLLPNPTGETMKFVDVSVPLRDAGGATVGVLAMHYSLSWARDVVRSLLAPARDREGLEVLVVAGDRRVVLGPDAAIGGILPVATPRDGHGWRVDDWPDGRAYLTGYSRGPGGRDFASLNWTVLVRQPVEAALAPARELRFSIIASGTVLAMLFGSLGWLAAGLIARPLQTIGAAAERLRRGEPGAVIPEVGGAVEIRALSRTLRDLVASLTASKEALGRMQDIAYQDRLTALPNRRFFEQYLEAALARARSELGQVVALYIDLDGFKPINDRLGHDAGDEVLRQVSVRLASSLRSDDVVARIGGDEFAAVLISSGCTGRTDPMDIPERFIAAVNEPIVIDGESVQVGCSVGIAVWPLDGADLTAVLKRADEALYEAKRRGKNQAVQYASMARGEFAASHPEKG